MQYTLSGIYHRMVKQLIAAQLCRNNFPNLHIASPYSYYFTNRDCQSAHMSQLMMQLQCFNERRLSNDSTFRIKTLGRKSYCR